MKLPIILHVRDAHEDALRILIGHPARKLSGVIHDFCGSKEIAEQYLEAGMPFRYRRLCTPVGGMGEGSVGSGSLHSSC